MKKLIILFTLLWVKWLPAIAQAVTTDPAFPNGDQEITLIFDLTQAKDASAKGLLGKKDDVFLWSGAGSTDTGNAFEFQPAGQSNFAAPYEKGKMTSLGNDRWSIKLTPRTYYAVPTGTVIKRLGVLLKSGNGSNQTEDFFVTMYDNKLNIALLQPREKTFFVASGTIIPVVAVVSKKSDFVLTVNGTSVLTVTNKDSLKYALNVGTVAGASKNVKITATSGTETATSEFTVTVQPTPTTDALPVGVKDGINYVSDTKVTLVLFAPRKDFIYAVGEFNNWVSDPKSLMKRTPDGNRYWIDIEGLTKGQEYAFQYVVNGTIIIGDPYCDKILDPNNDGGISPATYPNIKTSTSGNKSIASVFQTGQVAYPWKITNFKRPAQDNLMIYELHVRDFDKDGSYKNVIDRISYLKTLGVNCIELMPVAEFSNNDSWGYNPTYYFAVDKAYGTKDDFKKFVDVCHENGMAVVLDVVYNQADYEFPYVKMYWDTSQPSTDSPMFNKQAPHPYSVFFDFNHENQATKDYINRANQYWLQEFKIDGYRFDLAKGFTQTKSLVGSNSQNEAVFRTYDQSRVNIWKNYYDKIRSYDKDAYVILEMFSEDKEETVLTDMGMMVWANQNGDARNAVKGNTSDFTRYSYKERGFSKPAAVGYMESHDEERIAYDALQNSKVKANITTVLERTKAAAAMFLTIPGPKMIWQFGELGYDVKIEENGRTGRKPIKWEYFQDADRLKLYKVYSELIKLKMTQDILKTADFTLDVYSTLKKTILVSGTNKMVAIANMDVISLPITNLFPNTGKWYDYFTGNELNVTDLGFKYQLQAGQFHIFTNYPLPKPEANLVPWTLTNVLANEEEQNQAIKVYPNPSKDFIQLEIPAFTKGVFSLKINDLTGRNLSEFELKGGQKVHSIDIQKLPQGVYFLNAEQGDKRLVKKIVKE